jgi:hypothetical protein
MEIDDIGGLRGKTDDVDTTGEGLEVDVRTDGCTPEIHHFECIFLTVEVKALETGAAADFDVLDSSFSSCLQSGKKVVSFNTGSET